jgi:hypothetical protein
LPLQGKRAPSLLELQQAATLPDAPLALFAQFEELLEGGIRPFLAGQATHRQAQEASQEHLGNSDVDHGFR